jgi:arylsulfatase A-like enzyme/Flp pilus assembly protein TadD
MNFRIFSRAVRRTAGGALFLLFAVILSRPAAEPRSRAGLNLLLITIDTLRADRLSCYDPTHVETPSIDGLAASGTAFMRAFTHTPLTLPAHTSILLGKTPPAHGVHDNGRFIVREEFLTLAEHLKGLGYSTGAFVSGYPLHSRFGLGQGFDVYDDHFTAAPGVGREFAERRAAAAADNALSWVKGQPSPWFLWVHFYDPHDPYEPPEPFRTKYKDAPYDGEVAYVDETVGRLLAFLRDQGLADGTMVVLTGDHGESLGEHGELTHGFLTYNSTLWIPLIIRIPGMRPSRVDQTVSHVDIFPTVCDALSVSRPGGLEGRSLVPAMAGRKLTPQLVYFECLSPYYGRGWAPIRGTLDGRMKFTESPIPELYDLEKDFGEAANLAGTRDLAGFRRSLDKMVQAEPPARKSGAETKLDAAAVEKLRSLGYAAGPAVTKNKTFGPEDDVKTLLPYYEKAMEALALSRTGRGSAAVERLKEVITARPDLDVAHVNLALVYEADGRIDDARKVLADGLKALPESYDLFTHAIGLDIATGDFRAAVDLAESHSPPQMDADPKIWVDLGICYRNLKDYARALTAYETALAVDPTYPVIYNNLGTLQLALDRENPDGPARKKAVAYFEKAVELDPEYAVAFYGLGQAHYRSRDYDRAVVALKKAVGLDPGLVDAQFFLGMAYYHEELYADALAPLEAYRESARKSLDLSDLKQLDGVIAECRARK